ncbi:MAG: tetraacyldisaccharide 4'-kinase, partial [Planctomycetes bacterium]|nr:tetraacyldisaccharide 4'-kinase [Planctomycetota bacterium]
NPEAFRREILSLGLTVAAWMPFRDHHRYRPRDIAAIGRRALASGAEAVVTTQKDAVKLAGRGLEAAVVRVRSTVVAGEDHLEAALSRALAHG